MLYGVGEEEDIIVRHVIEQTGVNLDDRDIERAHSVGRGRYSV